MHSRAAETFARAVLDHERNARDLMTIRDRPLVPCVRSFVFDAVEVRDGAQGYTFEGVASVVDRAYSVTDRFGTFRETIKAGAFNKTLRDGAADVALFVNHDYTALPLATRLDGSLKLTADPDLRVVAVLDPDRPSVQEAVSAVRGGQARQMSIGFTVPNKARDKWNDDMTEREIAELALLETSIVWRGANPFTTGGMRSALDAIEALTADDLDADAASRAVAHLRKLHASSAPSFYVFPGVSTAGTTTGATLAYADLSAWYLRTRSAGTVTPPDKSAETTESRNPVVSPELVALWEARKPDA